MEDNKKKNEYKDFVTNRLDEIERRIKEINHFGDFDVKCKTLDYISSIAIYIGLDYNMNNVKRFVRLVNDFFGYILYPVDNNINVWKGKYNCIESLLADLKLFSLKCLRNVNIYKYNRTEFENMEEASPLICLQNCSAYYATLYSVDNDWYNLSKILEKVIEYTKKNIEYVLTNPDCERLIKMNSFSEPDYCIIRSEYWFEPLAILYHEGLFRPQGSFLAIAHEQIFRHIASIEINDDNRKVYLETKELFRQRCSRMYKNACEAIEREIKHVTDEAHKIYLTEQKNAMYEKYLQYEEGNV